MKLIFENWKRCLKENLSYFGKAFVEFKNRVDAGEDALTVADDILYPLGEGSTRVVFGFPDNHDIVLKVINTKNPDLGDGEDKYGFSMKNKAVSNENEVDFQIHQGYPGLFPKGYERAQDYSWIVTERVDPMDHQEMLQHFGLPPLVNKKAYKKLASKMSSLKSSLKRRSEQYEVLFDIDAADIRSMFYDSYGKGCRYCDKQLTFRTIACDHIIPLTKGGPSTKENLQLVCKTCNTRKGPLNEEDFTLLIQLIGDLPEELSVYVMKKLAKGGRY